MNTDTITLKSWNEPSREVGVGDEVVIKGRHGELSIATITSLTKTTIKTTRGTFARKSLREYGAGNEWYFSTIIETQPDKARRRIAKKQAEDARLRAILGICERVHAESANLTMDDITAIVAILDEATARKEDA